MQPSCRSRKPPSEVCVLGAVTFFSRSPPLAVDTAVVPSQLHPPRQGLHSSQTISPYIFRCFAQFWVHDVLSFSLRWQHGLPGDTRCCLSAVLSLTCCFNDSSKRQRAAQHLAKGRGMKMEDTIWKGWHMWIHKKVHEGRGINFREKISLSFLPFCIPKHQLRVTLLNAIFISFHFVPLRIFLQIKSWVELSHNRPLVRTGSSFSTCDLIHDQTEISSALFSIQNYQAGGFVRLFANWCNYETYKFLFSFAEIVLFKRFC